MLKFAKFAGNFPEWHRYEVFQQWGNKKTTLSLLGRWERFVRPPNSTLWRIYLTNRIKHTQQQINGWLSKNKYSNIILVQKSSSSSSSSFSSCFISVYIDGWMKVWTLRMSTARSQSNILNQVNIWFCIVVFSCLFLQTHSMCLSRTSTKLTVVRIE